MNRPTALIATLLALASFAGCAAPHSDSNDGGPGQAQVAFYVKDAPADEFESVFVTFTKVEVHKTGTGDGNETASATTSPATTTTNATATATNTTATTNLTTTSAAVFETGWITLVSDTETVDLKAFQGDARAFLGDANITAGKYTQIRITISEAYGIRNGSDERVNFTVPSMSLKITGPFDAKAGEVTQLIVDFELDKSLHATGQGKYMFKPTMKLQVDHKSKLDPSDTEEPSKAATKARGKPTDKGRPTNTTATTATA